MWPNGITGLWPHCAALSIASRRVIAGHGGAIVAAGVNRVIVEHEIARRVARRVARHATPLEHGADVAEELDVHRAGAFVAHRRLILRVLGEQRHEPRGKIDGHETGLSRGRVFKKERLLAVRVAAAAIARAFRQAAPDATSAPCSARARRGRASGSVNGVSAGIFARKLVSGLPSGSSTGRSLRSGISPRMRRRSLA